MNIKKFVGMKDAYREKACRIAEAIQSRPSNCPINVDWENMDEDSIEVKYLWKNPVRFPTFLLEAGEEEIRSFVEAEIGRRKKEAEEKKKARIDAMRLSRRAEYERLKVEFEKELKAEFGKE